MNRDENYRIGCQLILRIISSVMAFVTRGASARATRRVLKETTREVGSKSILDFLNMKGRKETCIFLYCGILIQSQSSNNQFAR